MGAGHLKAFNVGGIARRWEYLVAGTPLSQIERSADLAQPGAGAYTHSLFSST